MFRGFSKCILLEKVNTALQNFEGPVRPNEGPWLVMDPVVSLECKNMANTVPPPMIKDSKTPAWLGTRLGLHCQTLL